MRYTKFTPSIIESLQYYVYTLIDPRTDSPFYIGKGTGNRIFAHLQEALTHTDENLKLDTIRNIHAANLDVEHIIHRHGLTEKEAFEVEAALIDFVGMADLANRVHGHHSEDRGAMTISDIYRRYDAPAIDIEDALLIIVNKLYEPNMTPDAVYEVTRGNWVISEQRRKRADYAFTVYKGLVREVYCIDSWEPVSARTADQKNQNRWRFTGSIATDIREKYIDGSIENYFPRGNQWPVLVSWKKLGL